MFLHPVIVGLVLLDIIAILFLLMGARHGLSIVTGWNPGATDAAQILRERRAVTLSVSGRGALGFFAASLVVFVMAVSSFLPTQVPGAMCGTGVLRASEGLGLRSLTFRLMALVVLITWQHIDRLARTPGRYAHAPAAAKGLLVALPFALMGSVDGAHMLFRLTLAAPVSCCGVLYSQTAPAQTATGLVHLLSTHWAWVLGLGGGAIAAVALKAGVTNRCPLPRWGFIPFGIVVLLFAIASVVIIKTPLSAAVIDMLSHHCLWCLFLEEHHFWGYLLAFSLTCHLYGAAGLIVSCHLAPRSRIRRYGILTLVCLLVYLSLAVGPALVGRFQHGVWVG